MKSEKVYKINGLAKELGVSIQTIKNYETEGILPKAQRDEKGWRYYTEEDVVKIKALYREDIKKLSAAAKESDSPKRNPDKME